MTEATKPWNGVPLHPETRRFHLLRSRLDGCKRASEWWPIGKDVTGQVNAAWFILRWSAPEHVASDYEYLGPLYTQAEAAALADAAAAEMREKAARLIEPKSPRSDWKTEYAHMRAEIADAIRDLPLPAPSLDAMLEPGWLQRDIERAQKRRSDWQTETDQPDPIQAINTLGRITEALGVPWDATASRILEVISAKQKEERQRAFAEAIVAVERHGEKLTVAWRSDGKRSQYLEGMADAEDEYADAIRAAMAGKGAGGE
jgi:hypothetical protein